MGAASVVSMTRTFLGLASHGDMAPGIGRPELGVTASTPRTSFSLDVPLDSREGLPIGSMLTAKFGRKDQLFRLAAQLEQTQLEQTQRVQGPSSAG